MKRNMAFVLAVMLLTALSASVLGSAPAFANFDPPGGGTGGPKPPHGPEVPPGN